jgi:hypothetical protein
MIPRIDLADSGTASAGQIDGLGTAPGRAGAISLPSVLIPVDNERRPLKTIVRRVMPEAGFIELVPGRRSRPMRSDRGVTWSGQRGR